MTEVLEPHVLTDKSPTKEVPCIGCGRICVVTTFATPSKVQCLDCKPAKATREPGSRPVVQAGRTQPELAAHLPDALINRSFSAYAICPFDAEHSVELKSIAHSTQHGPRRLTGYKNGIPLYDQQMGEAAMFQCTECNVLISFSTMHPRQYLRQNESKDIAPGRPTFYEASLGVREGTDLDPEGDDD